MGFNEFCAIFGGIKGSRWRKASQCKKLIKQLRQSLVIQKNRRNAMMRQLRADIAQLLQHGQHKAALDRVLQLHKDEHKLSAYDQVEKFCGCVDKNLNDISSDINLSVDVCEAVSSLIFAASRCGELPELHSLRNLFKGLLGQKFETANVELLPGNTVNSQIMHSLSVKSVEEDVKIQLINDIAREYKQHSELPIQVQARNIAKDGSYRIEDQTRAKKFEEMLPDIGPKFALRDCEDMVTFWSNFHEGSNSIAGRSFTSKEANTVTFEKGFNNSPNKKAVDEKCDDFIKKDSVDARYDSSVATHISQKEEVIRGQCYQNDRYIRAQCHVKDTEENLVSPISHVHPKLPDYDDLIVQFGILKKEYMQKNSTN